MYKGKLDEEVGASKQERRRKTSQGRRSVCIAVEF
jgi:hypothetical protein